ncbi:MAG: hypothetical protein R6U43_02825 [Candidatus Krumholzibacteriales bacterium]
MKLSRILVCFLPLLVTFTALSGAAVREGEKAPRFELPLFSGSIAGFEERDYIDSSELFGRYRITFLVLWNSECPHCVESLAGCEEFSGSMGGGSIGVIGICSGSSGLKVLEGLAASGASFPQLYDREGRAASAYTGSSGDFSIFAVSSYGTVLDRAVEPGPGTEAVMMRMYTESVSGTEEAQERIIPGGHAAGGSDNLMEEFVFSGDVRIRFLSADVIGEDAVGPYGEEIQPGNELLRRINLRISRKVGRYITAGGLLRISNEDPRVLEYGPEYFDNEWGSVFASFYNRGFSFRAGYYPVYMTPLTMMRWDWDDNPKTAGSTGCSACGAGSSGLFFRTLEELGPELYFEGGKFTYQNRNGELNIFYGIPRRARNLSSYEALYRGTSAAYSLETYGASLRLQGSGTYPWKLGFHFAGSREDERTVDTGEFYGHPFEKYDSQIYSITARLPFAEGVSAGGEFVPLSRTEGENLDTDYQGSRTYDGWGGYMGLELEDIGGLNARFDYIYLKDDIMVPFMALSYLPGMAGYRFSADYRLSLQRWSGMMEAVSVSLFYKRLSEIDTPGMIVIEPGYSWGGGGEEEEVSFAGVNLDILFAGRWEAGIGYIDWGNWRDGNINSFDTNRDIYTANLRCSFGSRAAAELQYQRIDITDDSSGEELTSASDIYSFYSVVEF